jgi:hypothetical protein
MLCIIEHKTPCSLMRIGCWPSSGHYNTVTRNYVRNNEKDVMFVQQLHEQYYSVQEMDSDIVLRVVSYLHTQKKIQFDFTLH